MGPLHEKGRGQPRLVGTGRVLLLLLVLWPVALAAESLPDLVLKGGRVVDPETGLDARRDVAITAGRIVAISEASLEGREAIDVSGLVVAPGFIDLHSHSPTPLGQSLQVRDGVTTALELEAGAHPVAAFGRALRGRAPVNFGASAGYGSIRVEVMLGIRRPHLVTGPVELIGLRGRWTAFRSLFGEVRDAFVRRASPRERERLRAALEESLDQGGLGIGLPLDYFSEGIDREELAMVFSLAAERAVPVFIHLRRGVRGDPAGLEEALSLARETGAPLHVCHVSHNAMGEIDFFLERMAEARAAGVDVTAEVLPYNAGSALISSAVFDRDWRTIFDIDYEDVEWAATGERFDEAMWKEYRRRYPDGQVVHHYLREEWTRRALREPGVIVVSDAMPIFDEESRTAPHVGAFSRVLGRYVREAGLLDLSTALAKMTWLPARRLETMAPAFRHKGRLQVGADADITVFDAMRVLDRATYREPLRTSQGISYVIVNGEVVVREGGLVQGALPGRWLRAPRATE